MGRDLAERVKPGWPAGWGCIATLALSAIGATGLLLRPRPATTYFTMWTPDLGHLEV